MKFKTYKDVSELATAMGLPAEIGLIAEIKAKMVKEVAQSVEKRGMTHQELSDLSGVPRSAITGIINGSLQKVSIARLIRLLVALGNTVDLKIKKIA